MAGAPITLDLVEDVTEQARDLTVERLKNVLRWCYLPVSGNKSILLSRITSELDAAYRRQDSTRFNQLQSAIKSTEPVIKSYNSPAQPRAMGGGPISHGSGATRVSQELRFKKDVFYTVIEALSPVAEIKVREHTRDVVTLTPRMTREISNRISSDPTYKVYLFAAIEIPGAYEHDIAFPSSIEIKVNDQEIKANTRGLKNKPGTTRPVDITSHLVLDEKRTNSIVVTYALTSRRFELVVNAVHAHSAVMLKERIKSRRIFSKDQVIREMKNRASDQDIIATSSRMSLKCPLSTMRITTACRSSFCKHNECFDAQSFLEMQTQAPTWTCPICNRSIPYESLYVDKYVENILQSTSTSTEQVTIEPDGEWHLEDKFSKPGQTLTPAGDDGDDDDDDLIEVAQPMAAQPNNQTFSSPLQFRTPVASSRQSTVSTTQQSTGKRPREVIDLTLSSDEDDEPIRKHPTKKQAMYDGASDMEYMPSAYPPQESPPFGLSFSIPKQQPRSYDYGWNGS